MNKMDEKKLQKYLDKKCSVEGCMYLCAFGYTVCEGHLHGFPKKLPDEIITYLKDLKEFDRIMTRCESQDQMERINGRMEYKKFSDRFTEKELKEMAKKIGCNV